MIEKIKKSDRIYQRMRLVHALAFVSSPLALEYLKGTTKSSDEGIVQQAAVRSVGIAGGESELEFLGSFLDEKDAQLRLAAAEAIRDIGESGSRKAQEVIAEFKKKEKASWLLQKLEADPTLGDGPLLKPVSSSEDRSDLRFNGNWSGVWARPMHDNRSSLTLNFDRVNLTIEVPFIGKPSGNVDMGVGLIKNKFKLENLSAKRTQLVGQLSGAFELKNKKGLPGLKIVNPRFEALLEEEAGQILIRMKVPELAGTFILIKEGL